MSRLKRPVDWYATWMGPAGRDDTETAAESRRKEANQLLSNIRDGHLDADTLEELIQILDYECLHLRTRAALRPSWTSQLVTQLSSCMFQVVYPASYYERELQFRALLSALALQWAQGAKCHQTDHHNDLQGQFRKGHRDLQWQQPPSREFSTERFRFYQCSFLLVTVVEYSKNFQKDEPVIAELLNRAMNLLLVGSSIALAASMNVRTQLPNCP